MLAAGIAESLAPRAFETIDIGPAKVVDEEEYDVGTVRFGRDELAGKIAATEKEEQESVGGAGIHG